MALIFFCLGNFSGLWEMSRAPGNLLVVGDNLIHSYLRQFTESLHPDSRQCAVIFSSLSYPLGGISKYFPFGAVSIASVTSSQSSKLRYFETRTYPPTDSLTVVKCRATSLAKNQYFPANDQRMGDIVGGYLSNRANLFFWSPIG